MKCRVVMLAGLLLANSLTAATFYVDATKGLDTNDGLTAETARKSLQGVFALVTPTTSADQVGDTVFAAEGDYEDETYESDTGALYRAHVPDGCRLIATGVKFRTRILGAASTDATAVEGCGPGAVACLHLGKWALVKGFTVTGGRSTAAAFSKNGTDGECGVAFYQTYNSKAPGETSYVVDCVVNDIRAVGGGCCIYGFPTPIRTSFSDFKGVTANALADAMQYGKAWNCVFDTADAQHYALAYANSVNCTFTGKKPGLQLSPSTHWNDLSVLPSMVEANKTTALYDCVVRTPVKTGTQPPVLYHSEDNLGEANTQVDSDLTPVPGHNVAIDFVENTQYATAFPTSPLVADQKDLDFNGNQRFYGDALDAGAVEYNPIGRMLAPTGVYAAQIGLGVAVSGSAVRVPAGSALTVRWAYPSDATGTVNFRFSAALSEATLTVTDFETGAPLLTAAEGGSFVLPSKKDLWATFAVTGTGFVDLSAFADRTSVTLTYADASATKGLVVTGPKSGTTVDLVGDQTVELTFTRNYSPKLLCTGVRIKGVFYSFTGETEDLVVPYTVTSAETGEFIFEAVYAEHNDWYVDCGPGGDDDNNGYTKYQAKKTLKGAFSNSRVSSGDVVHAAPGTYDAETMKEDETDIQENRVVVKGGVGLVADGGPSVTTILGANGADPETGMGMGAVRCVYLKGSSYVRGFTITGGRTNWKADGGTSQNGGGVYVSGAGAVIDCVITNNYASYIGGGIYSETSGTVLRCLFKGNDSAGAERQKNMASGFGGSWFDCVFEDSTFSGNNKAALTVVNCLVGPKSRVLYANAYNTLCLGDNTSIQFFDSLVRKLDNTSTTNGSSVVDATLEMPAAPTYRPAARTDRAVDFCSHDYEAELLSENWRRFSGQDITGGQRIYNGTVDCGAGEYDWRGDDARQLGRGVTVTEVSPSAVLTADGIRLTEGVLAGETVKEGNFELDFTVDGTGTLKLFIDGALAGSYTQASSGPVSVGELPAGTSYKLVYEPAAEDAGGATISRFGPRSGLILLFR